MSHNLKVAKECGAMKDGDTIGFYTLADFEAYTSRILASQQAAHEAELARLKEENAHYKKQGADRLIGLCKCGIEREELQQQVSEWERKQLEPLRAQVAMLNTKLTTYITTIPAQLRNEEDVKAIRFTQVTAEQFIAECEERGAVKALANAMNDLKICGVRGFSLVYLERQVTELLETSKKAG